MLPHQSLMDMLARHQVDAPKPFIPRVLIGYYNTIYVHIFLYKPRTFRRRQAARKAMMPGDSHNPLVVGSAPLLLVLVSLTSCFKLTTWLRLLLVIVGSSTLPTL